MLKRWILVPVAGLLGCGDDEHVSGPRDGSVDAADVFDGDADGASDSSGPPHPEPPEPPRLSDDLETTVRAASLEAPALPAFTPCPNGWVETPVTVDDRPLTVCDPWPTGFPECGLGERAAPSPSGCVPLGAGCPEGDFAADVPDGASTVYARPDAPDGGDGSKDRPFATLSDALSAVREGGVVALGKGEFRGPVTVDRAGVRVVGACARDTEIEASFTSSPAVTVRADGVVLERLSVRQGQQNVLVQSAADFELREARLEEGVQSGLRLSSATGFVVSSVAIRDGGDDSNGSAGLDVRGGDGAVTDVEVSRFAPASSVSTTDAEIDLVRVHAIDSRGMLFSFGSQVVIDDVSMVDGTLGLAAEGRDTRIEGADFVSKGAADGIWGFLGASVDVSRIWVDNSFRNAIHASAGGDVTVDHGLASTAFTGFFASNGGQIELERFAAFDFVIGAGGGIEDSRVDLRDVLIDGNQNTFSIEDNTAMSASASRLDGERVRVTGPWFVSYAVANAGTSSIAHVDIDGGRTGIYAESGARIGTTTTSVDSQYGFEIIGGSHLQASDVRVVASTLGGACEDESRCSLTQALLDGRANGLISKGGSELKLSQVVLKSRNVQSLGVVGSSNSSVDVVGTVVEGFEIAIVVFEQSRLTVFDSVLRPFQSGIGVGANSSGEIDRVGIDCPLGAAINVFGGSRAEVRNADVSSNADEEYRWAIATSGGSTTTGERIRARGFTAGALVSGPAFAEFTSLDIDDVQRGDCDAELCVLNGYGIAVFGEGSEGRFDRFSISSAQTTGAFADGLGELIVSNGRIVGSETGLLLTKGAGIDLAPFRESVFYDNDVDFVTDEFDVVVLDIPTPPIPSP